MSLERTPLDDFPADVLDGLTADAFFSSAAFARLWETKGGRPVVWSVSENGEIVALMTGVEFGRSFWRRFMSMPDGCYGGVLCAPGREAFRGAYVSRLLDGLLSEGYLRTYVFDFGGDHGDDPRFCSLEQTTTLVDISDPEWLPPDKKLRTEIRKAEREGLEIEDFDWARHGDAFMTLMESTERRHGQKPRYPRAFFRALAEAARGDDRIRWAWSEREGRGVCSHIFFRERGMLQEWQVYFDKAYSFLKPTQSIRFTVCREASAEGVGLLNMGCSPDGAAGLSYYKNRWGGEAYGYRGLTHRGGPRSLVGLLR